jgi:signal transduction histidine kinase
MRPRVDRILDYREFPILYVDDEPENLRIFQLTFEGDFTIRTATSGAEALEILNEEPISLVLSDQKMPGMIGTEFLERVAGIDPKTVRILVTAYGDAETLGNAINNGAIYRFVAKPWSPEDMSLAIRRGIEVYALDRERGQLLRELTLLNQVSKAINQELKIEALMSLLVETITDEFEYDAAGILLLDDDRERMQWVHVSPGSGEVLSRLRGFNLSCGRAPDLFRKLDEGVSHLYSFSDMQTLESPVRDILVEVAAEEMLFVPLIGSNGAIGAFAIDNRRGRAGFTWEDRTLLEGLANQAVTAMENARLVDDLRRSREQVLRYDRLGTLGTLAAGLAHEINNPLVSIHTFLSMAPGKRCDDDPDFWVDYHALAASEVARIRRLVETMRQLGRDDQCAVDRECVDIGDVSRQVVDLVGREARSAGVQVSFDSSPDLPKVIAVRDHMHQLLMNLVLNSIHASDDGGMVNVKARIADDRRAISVEVSDNGHGITEENLERVFDPFFTTKGPDKGSGLGLMICHRIVADHRGTIQVVSRGGEGASFKVTLPLAADDPGVS